MGIDSRAQAVGITVTGHIDVPPDRLAAVRDAAPEHIRLTRAEPGCLKFDMTEGADGRFHVDEAFTDPAAFEAHQTRNRDSHWWQVTQGIPRHFDIKGLD